MIPKPTDESIYEAHALDLEAQGLGAQKLETNAVAANYVVDWFFNEKLVTHARTGRWPTLAEIRSKYRVLVLPPEMRDSSSRVRENAFQDAHSIFRSLGSGREVKYRRDLPDYRMYRVNGHIRLDEAVVKLPGAPEMRWRCETLLGSDTLDDVVRGRKRFLSGTVYRDDGKWYVRLLLLREGVVLNDRFRPRTQSAPGLSREESL